MVVLKDTVQVKKQLKRNISPMSITFQLIKSLYVQGVENITKVKLKSRHMYHANK